MKVNIVKSKPYKGVRDYSVQAVLKGNDLEVLIRLGKVHTSKVHLNMEDIPSNRYDMVQYFTKVLVPYTEQDDYAFRARLADEVVKAVNEIKAKQAE